MRSVSRALTSKFMAKTMEIRLRRFLWRLGRHIYMKARGEATSYKIEENGEAEIQAALIAATPNVSKLVVFDVGANVGEWTLSFLRQVPTERRSLQKVALTAFEPIPGTRLRLAENLARTDYGTHVSVEGIALSNTSGAGRMAVMSDGGGTNSLEIDSAMEQSRMGYEEVSKTPLTDYCKRVGCDHIHMLKIDTEGHDALVLEGALPLMQRGSIDVVQFEYNHRWLFAHKSLHDVFELVDGLPYIVMRIREDHLESYNQWHYELDRFFEANYLLVHHRALQWFDVRQGDFDTTNTWVRSARTNDE